MTQSVEQKGKRKILVVDDERSLRLLVVGTLQAYDYQVFKAENGYEALEIARRERPDLVLLDVVMPEMDGFEVCRRLKADPVTKDAVVVMLTVLAQEADRKKGLEAGADAYLTKPFSPTALLNKVKEIFSNTKD
jgi:DNA-binding response OmpR family regulator